jgi:hypothetical protein
MAKKRYGHQRGNVIHLHNRCDKDFRQRGAVHRDGQQQRGHHNQQRRRSDGTYRSFDYNSTGQPDRHCRADGDL